MTSPALLTHFLIVASPAIFSCVLFKILPHSLCDPLYGCCWCVSISDVCKPWIADAMYWPMRGLEATGITTHIGTPQKTQSYIGMTGILQYFNSIDLSFLFL